MEAAELTVRARAHGALAATSRVKLLDTLRASAHPMDARELSAACGLHVSTVRFHLDVLSEAGLIRSRPESSRSRGRPRLLYTAATGDEARDAAAKQFADGDDDVQGVPSSVLLSWYRRRDLYRVDPSQVSMPKAAGPVGRPSGSYNRVFAQLGGIASSIVARSKDCLATVTDGDGRILALWGAGATMRRAAASSLPPCFTWSESTVGTDGMGTVLSHSTPLSVRGPEHWCEALHGWDCVGVGIYDVVTREPVAAINVSSWMHDVPVLPRTLSGATEIVRQGLREQALQDADEVARAFANADRRAGDVLMAADVAGRVIAANDNARELIGRLADRWATDPAEQRHAERPLLREPAEKSTQCARGDPGWVGSADLGAIFGGDDHMFDITPLLSADGVIGLLLASAGCSLGDAVRIPARPDEPSVDVPKRILAVCAGRTLLLPPEEIRYAEAARHDVWLATDHGRFRAAVHGIENVERELVPLGFLRVHRSYLVNLARVREVSHLGNGVLRLSTHPKRPAEIPVSRRHAVEVRKQLGL
ncbi:MAG: LytTR family transcriptional regulator DNA-binding domain-containing protein [Pseudonocardiaceae bacterium]